MNERDYEAAFSVGTIYQKLNNNAEAVKYYQQAVNINPVYTKATELLKLLEV